MRLIAAFCMASVFTYRRARRLLWLVLAVAAKSTLARLLFRFYDVSSGSIRVDGRDIRDYTQSSLRAAIGIVPQDTVLFNDTLGYNLRYGKPAASDAELLAAIRAAWLDDFIARLPKGLDTTVASAGWALRRRKAESGDCAGVAQESCHPDL